MEWVTCLFVDTSFVFAVFWVLGSVEQEKTCYFNILKIVEPCFIHHPSLAPLYPLSSSTCGRCNERWWQWGLERLCIYHLDGGIRCVMASWMLGGTMDQGGRDVSFEISSSYVILFEGGVGVTHGVLIYIITCNSFAIFWESLICEDVASKERACEFLINSLLVDMLWDLLQLALITVSLVLRDLQRFDSVWLLYTVRVYGIGLAIHRL